MDSLGERTQLIIALFQLILVIALGYDTTTRLEPELAITTDKGTDNDGRTFISRNGELWFQAGSGVVAKSNDQYELEECNNKLGALTKAIHIAEKL